MSGKDYHEDKVSIDKFIENKEARPWNFLNPNTEYVDEKTKEKRYSICQSCDKFIKITTQCKECGCIMKLKTILSHASCPLNKW